MRPTIFLLTAAFSALSCDILAQATSPENNTLETVIVTATGIARSGNDLDMSWSVADDELIDVVTHTHINELLHRVSGTWISRGNGQEHLTSIRSPVLTGAGGCGSFYMAEDGISLRAPGFCNVNQLFDANSEMAERVEVIKGPATARYGSNAMHGVINFISPRVDAPTSVRLELGPHDYTRLRSDWLWSSEEHSLRTALLGVSDGGYKDDSGYDQQKLQIIHQFDDENRSIRTVLSASNLNQETAGFISGEDAYKRDNRKKENPNPEAFRDARSLRLHSSWNITLSEGHSLRLTPYLRDNEMRFVQHFLPWKAIEENGHQSIGLRASGHWRTENLTGTYGLDIDLSNAFLEEFQPDDFSPRQPAGIHYDYEVDAKMYGAYSQIQYELSERLTLDAGIRLEKTSYDYDNKSTDGSVCEAPVSNCRFFRPSDSRDDFTESSINASLGYQLTPQLRAYLRVANAYRAPEATELYRLQQGQSRSNVDSEQLNSNEVGLAGEFDNVQFRIQLWQMDKRDVIFQDSDRQVISGARTKHHGVDVSLSARLSDTLQLNTNLSSALHRYDRSVELLGSRVPLKGNQIDTAPRTLGSVALNWKISEMTHAEVSWTHVGEYFTDPDNNNDYPGHDLLHLRVYTQPLTRWRVGVRVHNLLDEDYAERADFGFGSERYFVGEPRSYYLDLRYNFD